MRISLAAVAVAALAGCGGGDGGGATYLGHGDASLSSADTGPRAPALSYSGCTFWTAVDIVNDGTAGSFKITNTCDVYNGADQSVDIGPMQIDGMTTLHVTGTMTRGGDCMVIWGTLYVATPAGPNAYEQVGRIAYRNMN